MTTLNQVPDKDDVSTALGRMVKNGKNGIWKISDQGRKWLRENLARK